MEKSLLSLIFLTSVLFSNQLLEYEKNTISVYSKAAPSVVFIRSTTHISNNYSDEHIDIPAGAGSGFVWDKKGHIVTNYHVIDDGDSIVVDFDKKHSFKGTVIGVDSTKDLAVLKIDAPDSLLKPISLNSNNNLVVGRKVMAIGAPFGFQKTLTVGTISALGRKIRISKDRRIRDVIQTDADINPGNSGGPLLNSEAKLVGVNMMIYSTSGSSAGIGFAIPVHTVKHIVPQLIKFGKVKRTGFGISMLRDLNSLLPNVEGVAILKVPEGSNAEKAGFKGVDKDSNGNTVAGDIIIKIDSTVIEDNDDLAYKLEQCTVNQKITVTLLRDGKEITIPYTLQSLK